MKLSKMNLDTIKPESLNQLKGIRSWFTCKNPDWKINNQKVPGLNLGFNTGERREVIQSHRNNLIGFLNIEQTDIAYADQVHGTRVQTVSEGGTYGDTDALVTQIPGLALAIQVADCAAVLLADEKQKIIAAVHAGWRGAAGDILPSTINRMMTLEARPENIKAFVSPCISQQHFEVGHEVAEQFPDQFVDYNSYVKPHVDLKAFLYNQMQEMGLPDKNIEIHEGCTVAEEKRFYSYRREQKQSGRMLGIIQITI